MFRNFRLSLLTIPLLLSTVEAPAQTIEWWDRAGETYSDFYARQPHINQVKATPYGVYSVGQTNCTDVGAEIDACKGLLSKYDTDGRLAWRLFPEVGDAGTVIFGVAANADGVYVVGTALLQPRPGGPIRYLQTAFVQKYGHDGAEVWRYVDRFDGPPGHRIPSSTGCVIAVDDSGIYTLTGFKLKHVKRAESCGGFLRKLSFDGELLWLGGGGTALAVGEGKVFTRRSTYSADGAFLGDRSLPGNLNIPDNGLAYHDGALYFCSLNRDPNQRRPYTLEVFKSDLAGNVAWTVVYPKSERVPPLVCAIDVTPNGVYLASNLTAHRNYHQQRNYDHGLTVRQWDLAGVQTAVWDFPSLDGSLAYAVSVLDDAVFLAGHDAVSYTGFTAQASGDALLTPTAIGLDASHRLAVLDHHYGAGSVTAAVRRVDGTTNGRRLTFSRNLRPVDFFVAGDIDGNNADDLGILSRRPAVLEVVDSSSEVQLLSIGLDADFDPVAAVAAAATSPLIAVLMKHREKKYRRIEEFDAASGTSLRTISLNPNFEPLDLLVLGTGANRRYAVLATSGEAGQPGKLEIRDTNGSPAVNVWLGSQMVPQQALVYTDHNGTERIAILRRNAELGWLDIAVVDPVAAEIVQTLAFNPQYVPSAFVHSADIDANLSPQFSIAGRRDADGTVKVETRDLASGGLLHNAFLTPAQPIQDLVYLGPGSGAATPSLGLLIRVDADFAVVLVDLLTGQKAGELAFKP